MSKSYYLAFLSYVVETHKPAERGEVLPDLNEQPAQEQQLFQINESQGINLGNGIS
jgi:Spy/CpxP family protein refolding chaperone